MNTSLEFGCIGRTLTHSSSAAVHAALADYDYRLIPLEPEALVPFLAARAFRGINVTIPYKQAVIPYLDELDPAARRIGAVNTIVNRGGRLIGYNTDCIGMEALLRFAAVDITNKNVMILGTGGTARTAEAVARQLHAAETVTVSRSPGERAISYAEAVTRSRTEVILNTTPVGMFPASVGQSPLDLQGFPALCGVADAVYNPLRSALVLQAEARGIPAAGGLYMLVMQAVAAVLLFAGKTVPPETGEACFRKIRNETRNIVLIGMPAAGKTTVGKALSRLTGKPFTDTDALIEEQAGSTCRALLLAEGEAAFRARERRVIHSLTTQTGQIIATGGGCVLNAENIADLKANGILVYLHREMRELSVDESRPLSADRAALRRLYAERLPLYRRAADITLHPDGDAEATAKRILQAIRYDE